MSEISAAAIESILNGGVAVTPERRGFGKRRGVPDSVFWLAPETDIFPSHLLPVLVELEGSFSAAATDFSKFAARADDSDYQYHFAWPVIGPTSPEPVTRHVEYPVVGIRANQLTDSRSITEQELHNAFTNWFERFSSYFQTTTKRRRYGPTMIVEWNIDFKIFGEPISARIPFIVESGPNIDQVLKTRLRAPTAPSVVVVNGKYGAREKATYHHPTRISCVNIHPIRFRERAELELDAISPTAIQD